MVTKRCCKSTKSAVTNNSMLRSATTQHVEVQEDALFSKSILASCNLQACATLLHATFRRHGHALIDLETSSVDAIILRSDDALTTKTTTANLSCIDRPSSRRHPPFLPLLSTIQSLLPSSALEHAASSNRHAPMYQCQNILSSRSMRRLQRRLLSH